MKIRLPVRKPGLPPRQPAKLKLKASVARSRRAPIVEEEDFLEEPEPNMKLSHAFVVVLVLHVIAVAGVFAFNSIKARQADIISPIAAEPAKAADATASPETLAPQAEVPPNTLTAQPEPAKPAPIATAASGNTYELQPGETLTKVAATYGVSVADLQSANNITDPKTIRAGTMLVIPGASAASAKPEVGAPHPIATAPVEKAPQPPAPPAASNVKDSGDTYVVVKGDNPVKIAKKLKVPYESLVTLNAITDPRKLQIGQKLKIPGTAK